MTPAEQKLWSLLRRRQTIGVKFRRQHPVSRYIVDFFCHEANLVIEVDGGYHDHPEQKSSDQGRQKELESMGLTVIRFRNKEIEADLEWVLNTIRKVIREKGAM